jgi:uncharacterized protein YkwD
MTTGRKAVLVAVIAVIAIWAAFTPAGCITTSNTAGEAAGQGHSSPDPQAELERNAQYVRENADNLASIIHQLINEKRKENDLASLQWDQQLASIALSHSRDMAQRDYFDHISPEGKDFADRYKEHGYTRETVIGNKVYVGGENLFLNHVVESYTYDQETGEIRTYEFNDLEQLARSTVDGWMESEGHRENILTPFSREGIGVFVTDEGEVYITENFS